MLENHKTNYETNMETSYNQMKTRIYSKVIRATIMCFVAISSLSVVAAQAAQAAQNKIKNVIIMIPDGCSTDLLAVGRWLNGGISLALDERICALVRTYSSDSPISDSAPSGSAYACGHKSKAGFIATRPDSIMTADGKRIAEDEKIAFTPMVSLMEAAKLNGKATGLVFTCYLPHATPAAFLAHTPRRNEYFRIAKQMVHNSCDVVLGGGSYYIDSAITHFGYNAVEALKERDIYYTHSWSDWKKAELEGKNRIWGLFAKKEMKYEIDRPLTKEPSLADMTGAALDVLSKKDSGFFLMVEGSKIDFAEHDNDVPAAVYDFLAFDRAVKVATDFAKKDGNTIVIACPDHQTGGLKFGNHLSDADYTRLSVSEMLGNMKNYKFSYQQTVEDLFDMKVKANGNTTIDTAAIASLTLERYGITLSNEDQTDIKNQFEKDKKSLASLRYYANKVNKYQYIGWTTNGHTGGDVFLYIYNPKGRVLTGVVDIDSIAPYIAEQLGWRANTGFYLDSLTAQHYVRPQEIRKWDRAEIIFPKDNSGKGPKKAMNKPYGDNKIGAGIEPLYMELVLGKDCWRLYPNTDYVELNGKKTPLGGLVIFNGIEFFLPLSYFQYK